MSSISPPIEKNGLNIPRFFYGTAWKEEHTADLTFQALSCGFRALDTANQRKHYNEEGCGQGLQRFLQTHPEVSRDDLFLQTKFTYARGQDHRKPYNENDSFTQQVQDSLASSLQHLGVDHLDSYVLHGPFYAEGIGDEDLETWQAMESLVEQGQVKSLGVSNVSADQLEELCRLVRTPPLFVQNRCFARTRWDETVRLICRKRGLLYQGFSLLTANRHELAAPAVEQLAHKYAKTIPQIVFRFSQQLQMIPLTGTSQSDNMQADLAIDDFELSDEEIAQLESLAV